MLYETTLTRADRERYRAANLWPDRLLNDDLAVALARTPDKTAITDARGSYTYTALNDAVECCALGLLDLGVRHGDVVTVQLPNWNEFVIALLAIERIGAVINPIAPIFRQRELRSMLRLAQPVVAIVPAEFRGFAYPAMWAELQPETPSLRALVVVDGQEGNGTTLSWLALLARGAAQERYRSALAWLRPSPDDVSELIFTSGTTGEPKGVLHTANTLGSNVQAVIAGLGLTADDVIHMASTFAHQTGFLYGMRLVIQLGAHGVYQDVWDAARFVDLAERERVTFSMGATPFLSDILRAPNRAGRDLGSWRYFVCAGAPIPQPLADAVARELPCRLVPGWGMTENGLVTAVLPGDPSEKIVTSDGRPYPGMEVIVRDDERRPLLPGVEGELWARGAFTFVGYVQGRQFTKQFFDAEGWFDTGDRARMDAEGYIRITGRTKDLIIRGGENIPVKEIEDLLLRHPKVRNVALVAVPNPRLGEAACACIIPEPGQTLTLDDLRAYLAEQQVTRQFWPEHLLLLEEFPTTPSGKVQKFHLREIAREHVAVAR
jgi:cyclohexanecarboxylate-CoA ligase